MHYVSTRGHSGRKQFCEALPEGLAEDGGLYVPETYPRVDDATLDAWRTLSYPSLAFEILSLYVSDIPPADLKAISEKTYTPQIFGTPNIAPLRKLETGLYLQELSNGPTLAFKELAMQLLGNLLEYELARQQERDQWRHRERGRIRDARQERGAGLHDVAPRADERLLASSDVQPAGRTTSTTSL